MIKYPKSLLGIILFTIVMFLILAPFADWIVTGEFHLIQTSKGYFRDIFIGTGVGFGSWLYKTHYDDDKVDTSHNLK